MARVINLSGNSRRNEWAIKGPQWNRAHLAGSDFGKEKNRNTPLLSPFYYLQFLLFVNHLTTQRLRQVLVLLAPGLCDSAKSNL